MKILWKLYLKELRILTAPGIGMIMLINAGWLALFIKYLSTNIHSQYLDFFFHPVQFDLGGLVLAYPLLFLYAILYEHLTDRRNQGFSLPVRRTMPLFAKFLATATWIHMAVPVTFLLFAIHKALGCPYSLFTHYSLRFDSHVAGFMHWIIMNFVTGSMFCTYIMIGYTVAISVRRLRAFLGITTVIVSYAIFQTVVLSIANFVHYRIILHITGSPFHQVTEWLNTTLLIIMTILILAPALFVYERRVEI